MRATSPELYSAADVAVRLGVSLRTVRAMIASGELRAVRVGRKLVRVPADALDAAIRPYAGGPSAEPSGDGGRAA